MRLILGTFAALGVAVAAPAVAQSVGMQIVDTSGALVGTVTAIQGDNIQIKTDKHEALLPKASFALNNGKLLFGLTQAQLDSKIEESTAASQKAIVAGATVNGTGGAAVGKIETVETDKVTIALISGKRIAVPATGLRGNADGTVTIGYTADQLNALVSGGTPAATSGK
jgi:preprotein translocase subunit YajC